MIKAKLASAELEKKMDKTANNYIVKFSSESLRRIRTYSNVRNSDGWQANMKNNANRLSD